MKKLILIAAAALALGAGLIGPALADHNDDHKKETALLAGAKITLAEAVSQAEALHTDSRAVDADLDKDLSGKSVWEISVVTPDKIYDVILDAGTGAVISNLEDRD